MFSFLKPKPEIRTEQVIIEQGSKEFEELSPERKVEELRKKLSLLDEKLAEVYKNAPTNFHEIKILTYFVNNLEEAIKKVEEINSSPEAELDEK